MMQQSVAVAADHWRSPQVITCRRIRAPVFKKRPRGNGWATLLMLQPVEVHRC